MILEPGEFVHVITRRWFDEDVRRHFAGAVDACSERTARVTGRAFVFDTAVNEFRRLPTPRTRIVPLADAGVIVTVLPSTVRMDRLQYRVDGPGSRLVLTDGTYSLEISELGSTR